MNHDYDLLYIVFIDLDEEPKTGSAVRPVKMLKAFNNLGLKIKILSGWNNKIFERRKKVKEIITWLKTNKPKFCYIETPSGPFFCWWDLYLIKVLHKKKIPIGLFYRDAYWKFPEFSSNENNKEVKVIKNLIIKYMQKRDWNIFEKYCNQIYFPSESMLNHFNSPNKMVLEPGCEYKNINNPDENLFEHKVLNVIFVGGASKRYGTEELLGAVKLVNDNQIKINLNFCCPKEQWNKFILDNKIDINIKGLNIVHKYGDKELKKLYLEADFGIIALKRNIYNDFAVPIKLFEYLSYEKPILATKCIETERIIKKYDIGWIVADNENAIAEKMNELYEDNTEIIKKKRNCNKAIVENLWENRAKKVMNSLNM